jgi:hypothetical protein
MPLYAAIRRWLERKSLILLGFIFFSQAEGRGFAAEHCSASAKRAKPAGEPRLALQRFRRPDRNCDRAFLVRVMIGGLLGADLRPPTLDSAKVGAPRRWEVQAAPPAESVWRARVRICSNSYSSDIADWHFGLARRYFAGVPFAGVRAQARRRIPSGPR